MTMQRWRCSVRRLTRRRDRHHQAVLSEQHREMTKSCIQRFEHGQLQGGVHIHQGGVYWICVQYVYSLVTIGLEL